jgi:hypothetical protein
MAEPTNRVRLKITTNGDEVIVTYTASATKLESLETAKQNSRAAARRDGGRPGALANMVLLLNVPKTVITIDLIRLLGPIWFQVAELHELSGGTDSECVLKSLRIHTLHHALYPIDEASFLSSIFVVGCS